MLKPFKLTLITFIFLTQYCRALKSMWYSALFTHTSDIFMKHRRRCLVIRPGNLPGSTPVVGDLFVYLPNYYLPLPLYLFIFTYNYYLLFITIIFIYTFIY